jgi:hypothetical protein
MGNHRSKTANIRNVPFGVSSIRLILQGSYPPKTPHFGDINGDFQLKSFRAYLSQLGLYITKVPNVQNTIEDV